MALCNYGFLVLADKMQNRSLFLVEKIVIMKLQFFTLLTFTGWYLNIVNGEMLYEFQYVRLLEGDDKELYQKAKEPHVQLTYISPMLKELIDLEDENQNQLGTSIYWKEKSFDVGSLLQRADLDYLGGLISMNLNNFSSIIDIDLYINSTVISPQDEPVSLVQPANGNNLSDGYGWYLYKFGEFLAATVDMMVETSAIVPHIKGTPVKSKCKGGHLVFTSGGIIWHALIDIWTTDNNCNTTVSVDAIRKRLDECIRKVHQLGVIALCCRLDHSDTWHSDVRISKAIEYYGGTCSWKMPCAS